jgi:nucleoside-diphosphate-sugar epimerase
MEANLLVTGTRGGIGKYIYEQLGGTGFTIQSNNLAELKKHYFDVIIHCAWNYMSTWLVTNDNLGRYYYDNVLLTQELLQIPHKYFVFFSTIDIYPNDGQPHSETEIIYPDSIRSINGVTKLLSESLVRNGAKKFLILRPTSLLGPYMRKNNLLKLVEDLRPTLSLDSSSVYNLIRYPDILGFINTALFRQETGIFNLASTSNVSLTRIMEIVGKDVVFGDYHYNSRNILNHKVVQIFPVFKKTSEEVLKEFLAERSVL